MRSIAELPDEGALHDACHIDKRWQARVHHGAHMAIKVECPLFEVLIKVTQLRYGFGRFCTLHSSMRAALPLSSTQRCR